MGFPARMKRVTITVHNDYLDELLVTLHETGLIQIVDTPKSPEPSADEEEVRRGARILTPVRVPKEAGTCAGYELRIDKALEVLKIAAPPGLSLVKAFTNRTLPTKHPVRHRDLSEIFIEAKQLLGKIEPITLKAERTFTEIRDHENTLKVQEVFVQNLAPLGFDLGMIRTSSRLIIKAGWVDDIEAFRQAIQSVKDVTLFESEQSGGYAAVIVAHQEERENLDKVLRGRYFQEYDLMELKGTPEQVIERMTKEYENLETQREKSIGDLREIRSAHMEDLLILKEELGIERERLDVRLKFGATSNTHVITGWVLKRDVTPLTKLCNIQTERHVALTFEDPEPDHYEEVPVRMDNPRWAMPFELITRIFAAPRYNELDPTPLLAPAFVVFFGLMLGDAGYGLLLLGFCLYGYFKIGPYSIMMQRVTYIGILMSISTIIFGFMMGSFFGDLIPTFFYAQTGSVKPLLYNLTFEFPLWGTVHLPYDPIPQPLFLLIVGLIFGLFHLNLSIGCAAWQNFKRKKYRKILTGQISWWIFQPGFGILVWRVIFSGSFPGPVLILALVMTIVGIVLFAIENGGLFLFEITGYIGDWLSYSRLLALGLATAGLAMTINIVGDQIAGMGPVFIIFSGLLVIVAHFINFMLQALGAGVHSLRLQFVEFFGRFYEGGGHPFTPFKSYRLHTQLVTHK